MPMYYFSNFVLALAIYMCFYGTHLFQQCINGSVGINATNGTDATCSHISDAGELKFQFGASLMVSIFPIGMILPPGILGGEECL